MKNPPEELFRPDPFIHFGQWFRLASTQPDIVHPNAACLCTLSPNGYPDGRMLLIKDFDERGFVFYTNRRSLKCRSLRRLPRASLVFFWEKLTRQVRIQGSVESLPDEEADAYFATRPRDSQLGAWASDQSQLLPNRKTLENRIAVFTRRFEGKVIPRPPFWIGLRLVPSRFEFWVERPFRLHDRLVYERKGRARWKKARLYP